MNSLFELSAQYQALMDEVMSKDDLSSEILEALENINDSLDNKILNYASIVKTIEAKSTSIRNAMEEMEKRATSLEKSAERLREAMKVEMQKCDKAAVENDYHAVKLKINNPKVDYLDKGLIPPEFIRKRIKSIEEPNAILILQALKDNVFVPGVRMVRESRLEIR